MQNELQSKIILQNEILQVKDGFFSFCMHNAISSRKASNFNFVFCLFSIDAHHNDVHSYCLASEYNVYISASYAFFSNPCSQFS
jgi:hypothetical protein